MPSSPTHPLSGEGDLDPTEGHSQLLVGTLPLTGKDPPKNPEGKDPPQDPPKNPEGKDPPQDPPTNPEGKDPPQDPPKNPEDKGPPQEPSVEKPTSGSPGRNARHRKLGNTLPSEKSKHSVDTPSEYPPQDQSDTPIDPGEHLEKPPSKRYQKDPIADPFSRFWSGETADVTDKDKKRHRWLTRKPKRRHSDGLETLDGQDKRPYKYVLEGERDLLPRPRFYSRCPGASSISLEYADFILR